MKAFLTLSNLPQDRYPVLADFRRLSKKSLLKTCMAQVNGNQNERFIHQILQGCSKNLRQSGNELFEPGKAVSYATKVSLVYVFYIISRKM